jgi:hypothetical protein
MRHVSPAPRLPALSPANTVVCILSRTGADSVAAAVSRERTANPSIAELSKRGNGKGDRTDSASYFGSANSDSLKKDFTPEELRDFTARKQILWESDTTDRSVITHKEKEFIMLNRSNDPDIGYNRWPKFKKE